MNAAFNLHGNNDGIYESSPEFLGHNWHKNDFLDPVSLIEQSLTLIKRSARGIYSPIAIRYRY